MKRQWKCPDTQTDPEDKPKRGFKEFLKYHFVDSTAMLASTLPIFSAYETLIVKMSDEVSIKSKLLSTAATFGGLGWLVGKGRRLSKKLFRITDKTDEWIQFLHDSLYLATINIPICIGLYTASGETDPKKIAISTAFSAGLGIVSGPWVGYAIDAYEDMAGLKTCERRIYPDFIQRQSPKIKKGLAATLTAASVGLMALVYAYTPDRTEDENIKQETPVLQERSGSYSNDSQLEEILIEVD